MQQQPASAAAPAQGGILPSWLTSILRFIAFYYIGSLIFGKLLGTGGPSTTNTNTGSVNITLNNGTVVSRQATLTNTWPINTRYNFQVYLSPSNESYDEGWLVWDERGLIYDWVDTNNRDQNITFNTPDYLISNSSSLYAHILTYNIKDPKHSLKSVHPMIKYLPKPKPKGKQLLNTNQEEVEAREKEIQEYDPNELVPYWKPTLTINPIVDNYAYGPGSVPPEVLAQFNITEDKYSPVMFVNEFWLYKETFIMINDTVKTLNLTMSTYPLGSFKWQLYLQMQKSLDMQSMFGVNTEEDNGDDFKRMISDTNPYLLALTFTVTILHTVFEFLAFKNDIQFWRQNKSMDGLSVRSIMLHAVCQAIVFLYLLDNETNLMILVSCGFGVILELWKIGKAMIVTVEWTPSGLPKLSFKDKKSYTSKTKQYDDMAMKYLSWALFPLVIGTSIYSLYYHEHKSWYSWVVSSLVRTVYTFEFIMMTPQLFINYKLKSVSRLPFKVFMYRALNTFIDDLFAFIIKMPLMHRLSCLRDDIVFIVYLYQRWIYPVDPNRTHYGGEDDEQQPQQPEQQATTKQIQDETNTSKEQKTTTVTKRVVKKEGESKSTEVDNEEKEKEQKEDTDSSSSSEEDTDSKPRREKVPKKKYI